MAAGLGIRPDPPAGWPLADCHRGDVVRQKTTREGDLTMRNRSMFRQATLCAVIFLGLGIAAVPLVLLALLFF
jgi:hypothetical protein